MSAKSSDSMATEVRTRYATAKALGAITYAEPQMIELHVAGTLWQLRFCPSLASKPGRDSEAAKEKSKEKTKKFDPFENPAAELLVADTSPDRPSHILVLNKFPIIANHVILATKTDKQQTHLLEPEDLYQTYACLGSWARELDERNHEVELFAFFNSGPHSGASQPHRHVQLLPVEDMKGSVGSTWMPLIQRIATGSVICSNAYGLRHLPGLPFVHFALEIPEPNDKASLFTTYSLLYRAASAAINRYRAEHRDDFQLHATETGDLPISYNLGMMRNVMVICPRRSEGKIVQRADGSDIDMVALNGTMLAGTLMVKNEEVYQRLQDDTEQLVAVLEAVGIPSGKGYEELTDAELDDANFPELRIPINTSSL